MNTAGEYGGALYLYYGSFSFYNSSLVSNTAEQRGGGIYIIGYSYYPSFLDMSSVTLQSNKQIGGGTDGSDGGGGLFLEWKVTANIRECTFIRNEATAESDGNKHGHQIFTKKDGSDIPSIAIVNTKFTDVSGSNAFYGYVSGGQHGADKYVSPTTCASNPCTVTPFTGSCSARTNTLHGTLCQDTTTSCPSENYLGSSSVSESSLPPTAKCTPWTVCGGADTRSA